MLPLFIVEDIDVQRKRIEEAIRDYILIEDMEIEIVMATADPNECLEYIKKNPDLKGLYFLDVDLKADMDGIELGKKIKEYDPNGRIVIVTTKGAMAFFTFTYRLEVLDYIVKESVDEVIGRIRGCVKTAYDRYMKMGTKERGVLEIKVGNRTRNIPIDEVCFIETGEQEHRLLLHTLNGKVDFRGYIKEIAASNPALIRVHRAYLVNLNNAKKYDEKNRKLEMENGEICYVSVRKMNEVKKAFEKRENAEW